MIIKRTPQAASPLASWLSYLENLHSKTIDLGLERVSQVAARLGVLKPAPFVFTVAGTNGKGTTCRTLESILMAAGYKVGVYSSPHLVRYTERVRIQGEELPESAHCESFAVLEAGRGDISLTYFEYGTLCALWVFARAGLDQGFRRRPPRHGGQPSQRRRDAAGAIDGRGVATRLRIGRRRQRRNSVSRLHDAALPACRRERR